MKKKFLLTRQNKKGNWWCSTDTNVIERPTAEQAQNDMLNWLLTQGYLRENIKLDIPIPYVHKTEEKPLDLTHSIGNVFLDHNPIA